MGRPAETRYLYHVNLLPYNVARAVQDGFARVGDEAIESFQQVLQQAGISSSYRNSFGHGIDAACGQLFAGYEQKGTPPLVRPATSAAVLKAPAAVVAASTPVDAGTEKRSGLTTGWAHPAQAPPAVSGDARIGLPDASRSSTG